MAKNQISYLKIRMGREVQCFGIKSILLKYGRDFTTPTSLVSTYNGRKT